MGHIRRAVFLIICVCLLTTAVFAQSSATSINSTAYVSSDGSCQITLDVMVHLETPADKLTFPLPKGAKDVTMNGTSVRTYSSSTSPDVILADLSSMNGILGDYRMSFSYRLNTVLKTVDGKLVMEIPLLCGFDYPVQAMSFNINMPGEVSGKPSFTSAFLQSSIDTIIDCVAGGKMISGSITQPLTDRETLTLVMNVSEEMFPGKLVIAREGNPEVIPMAVCAVLALLYWLLLMRSLPLIRQRRATPPDGITAGEIGCRLTMAGVDLTMMVYSWAQLGYVRIVPDKYGRVLLYRRMDMGNERSAFENHVFGTIFARSDAADATGMAYAKLCRKTAETVSGAREMHRRKAGSARLFRAIASGVSLFSGVCFAMNLVSNTTVQVLLSIVLGALGVVTAWGIQGGMYKLHVRGKIPVYIALICMLVWILMGVIAGQVMIAVWAVLAQMAAGLFAAYGGRRSDLGRYQGGQILGLRHYLCHIPKEELERNIENNPDYFFDMLPYAIALGVDTRFARQFGSRKIGQCTYLTARQDRQRSAAEWALLLRKTADRMDKKQRRLELEKWFPVNIGRR